MLEVPWHVNTDEHFESACRQAEIWVLLTQQQHAMVLAALRYDKRPQGSQGRALAYDIPEVGLQANDRLELCDTLQDVAAFDGIAAFPSRVLFWRPSRTTLVLFRSPLWAPDLGLTPTKVVAVDLLHTFHLGVLLAWCKACIWLFLDQAIWGQGESTAYEQQVVGLRMLKAQLDAWYNQYDQANPEHKATRISVVTPKMLGVGSVRKLKTKAMETFF